MKKIFCLICLFVLLISVNCFAFTEVHYVTDSGATTMDGESLASAFNYSRFNSATYWSSNDADDGLIGPNDVVYFHGAFTHAITTQGSGTSGKYITLDGYEAGDCSWVAGGTDSDASFSGTSACIKVNGHDYIIVQDFKITGGPTSGTSHLLYLAANGSSNVSNYVTFRRNYSYNANGCVGALYGYSSSSRAQNITFTDNKLVGFCKAFDTERGFPIVWVDNLICQRNIFGHTGAYVGNEINVVEVHASRYHLWEYNEIYGAPDQGGISFKELSPGNQYMIFRFNKIHDNLQGNGVGIGGDASSPCTYFYVYGNYIYNNGLDMTGTAGGRGIECDFNSGYLYIFSNIISNNARAGIGQYSNLAESASARNVYIYNNTFAFNGDRGSTPDNIQRGGIVFSGPAASNIFIKNNIFHKNRPLHAGSSNYYNILYEAITSITLDYDTAYWDGSSAPTWYYNVGNRTLATMQGTYSQEANGLLTNPQLTDPDGADNDYGTAADNNFKLSAGSPSVNNGLDLGSAEFGNVTIQGTVYHIYPYDGLDPELTNWSTTPPAVFVLDRDDYNNGSWGRGAYVFKDSVVVQGTVFATTSGGISESEVVAGGQTIDLTISGTVWNTLDNTIRAAIVAGMDSAVNSDALPTGWDAKIKANPGTWSSTGVVLIDSTHIRITLPATGDFAIDRNDGPITITVPASAVASGATIVAEPTFTISNETETPPPAPSGDGFVVSYDANGGTWAYDANGFVGVSSVSEAITYETITAYGAANNDDGYYTGSTWYSVATGSYLRLGLDSTHRSGHFRFLVNIPDNAIIDTAYLYLTCGNAQADGAIFTVSAENTLDAGQIGDATAYLAQVADLTTANVSWDLPATVLGTTYSIAIPTVVQEVVDDENGSNHLQIFLVDTASTVPFRPYCYEHLTPASEMPKIVIIYHMP